MEQEIPEDLKQALRKKFEFAADKGKWLLYGGKIVIQMDRPKVGQKRLVKATVILETVTEI